MATFAHFFQKMHSYTLHWNSQCRNSPKKKTLISALMCLRTVKILVWGWIDVVADMGGDTCGEFDF
jgi:hypothetical protein